MLWQSVSCTYMVLLVDEVESGKGRLEASEL